MKPTVAVFPTSAALAAAAAEHFVAVAASATLARGECSVALSGGSTPRAMYILLASPAYASRVRWKQLHLFWSDERCVPPNHAASNYRMARETLLDHVAVPAANVHRIHGEDGAERAAAAYEQVVRKALRTPVGPPRTDPGARFDVVLLGLGTDGHTASLMPGRLPADDPAYWIAPVPDPTMARVTFGPALIDAAADIVFLVSGADKAAIVRRVLDTTGDAPVLPAQRVAAGGRRVHWMLDAAAAAQLEGANPC